MKSGVFVDSRVQIWGGIVKVVSRSTSWAAKVQDLVKKVSISMKSGVFVDSRGPDDPI